MVINPRSLEGAARSLLLYTCNGHLTTLMGDEKMTYRKTTLLTSLALAALAFTTTSANADTYHHIDKMAVEMQSRSRELLSDFSRHYRYKAGYSHLRSDALQLYRAATHLHSMAHQHRNVHHMRSDYNKMDRLFHHLQEALAATEQSFGGHTHGNTQHVFELMHDFEDNLHHLDRDLKSLEAATHHGMGHHNTGHGHTRGRIVRPTIGYSWGSGGVYLNGNRWSIRFGH
jgi:hypothetical protein